MGSLRNIDFYFLLNLLAVEHTTYAYVFVWFLRLNTADGDADDDDDDDDDDDVILLMAEILHQLIGSLPHYLQDFLHPRWCRISSINSMTWNKKL